MVPMSGGIGRKWRAGLPACLRISRGLLTLSFSPLFTRLRRRCLAILRAFACVQSFSRQPQASPSHSLLALLPSSQCLRSLLLLPFWPTLSFPLFVLTALVIKLQVKMSLCTG